MAKRILVTGGAGFIGSNLVDSLIDKGHSVAVIDDLSTGLREYLNKKTDFFEADIRDRQKVAEIFERNNFDAVFHLAAQIDVRISVKDPALDNDINVLGGLNILENSRKNGVKKLVFISTGGAIYGDTAELPTTERVRELPLSPYGIHKLTFEKYLNYYKEVYGQEYLTLRLANVYGPRQYKGGEAGVVAIFTDHAVEDQEITINGDGLQTRDFVYVGDVVKACLAALEADYAGEINIGTGIETDLLEVVGAIEKALGKEIKKKFGPAKEGEQRRSCLDHGRAKEILGWTPDVFLEEGIKKTIDWAKNK